MDDETPDKAQDRMAPKIEAVITWSCIIDNICAMVKKLLLGISFQIF